MAAESEAPSRDTTVSAERVMVSCDSECVPKIQYRSDARYNERAFAFACNRVCVRVQPRLRSWATAFAFACNRVCFRVQTRAPLITNAFASTHERVRLPTIAFRSITNAFAYSNRQQTRSMPCRDAISRAPLKRMSYKCKAAVCT